MKCKDDLPLQMRSMSDVELGAVESLKYKSPYVYKICQETTFSHNDFIDHLEDLKKGKVPKECPKGCGKVLSLDELKTHIIDIDNCTD